jgi:hypothetical protein
MLSQHLRSLVILDATPYLHAGYQCCAACTFAHFYTSFPNWRHGETCAKDNNLYPVWGDDTILENAWSTMLKEGAALQTLTRKLYHMVFSCLDKKFTNHLAYDVGARFTSPCVGLWSASGCDGRAYKSRPYISGCVPTSLVLGC